MSLCACCGQPTGDHDGLCAFHTLDTADWAVSNRIMCDFIHRGIVAPRPRKSGDLSIDTFELVEALAA